MPPPGNQAALRENKNRINSAGKRVESEEKAFTNLISVYPEVNKSLEDFFIAVHGGDASAHSKKLFDGLTRDNLLRRQKENRFGFKLFMRTLAQVLAYHSNRAIGASTFSFESVNAVTMNHERTCTHLPDILDKTDFYCFATATFCHLFDLRQ